MENAKEFIREMLGCVNPDNKPHAFRWLNSLYCAVNADAMLSEHQSGLLHAITGEVDCQWRSEVHTIPTDVFVIAAWINTCKG